MATTHLAGPVLMMEHVLSWPTVLPRVFEFILADKDTCWKACPSPKDVSSDHTHSSSDKSQPEDPPESNNDHHCSKCISYTAHGVLFRCLLVNKLWFHYATSLLWKQQDDWRQEGWHNTTLTDHMARLASSPRRQCYANMTEAATEWTTTTPCDEVFEGVEFSKLRMVRMKLDYEHVPKIDGRSVRILVLEPTDLGEQECTCCGVVQHKLDLILEQIVEVFPNVTDLRFEDKAVAYPGAMERFRGRMKKLEQFDHGMVTEEDGYPE